MLDVSAVLTDPLISDSFDVRRQNETVGSNGRTTTTDDWFRGECGVVLPEEGAGLTRRDDGQYAPHTIVVKCAFALRDARFGFQPDVILWNGVEYLVVEALPFQRVAGFTKARATSTRATDSPQ